LRINHSPLHGLPFADRLARGSTLPVKSGLEMLAIVDRAEPFALPPAVRPVLSELEARGHRVTVREIRGPLDAVRFYLWYVRYAQRNFDLLVDATEGGAASLLRFSSKPKILRAALTRLPEAALREAFESMARACGYTAFLWRSDSHWVVSASGTNEHFTVLRRTFQS
jgi:hypothetical protein